MVGLPLSVRDPQRHRILSEEESGSPAVQTTKTDTLVQSSRLGLILPQGACRGREQPVEEADDHWALLNRRVIARCSGVGLF